VCLAVVSASAAVTIMLSGYATGGQVGLPLAAAFLGAAAAALLLPRTAWGTGPLGVAIIGLFSLLLIGRFFGELTTIHAILLFCAPVLGWLSELPYLRRLPPWVRGLARVLLVVVLACAVVVHAAVRFAANSEPSTEPGSEQPSIQDYMDSGR
jgi:hypothetical protein